MLSYKNGLNKMPDLVIGQPYRTDLPLIFDAGDGRDAMTQECVASMMRSVVKGDECVRSLSFLAPSTTTAGDLQKVCTAIGSVFVKEDAVELCTSLSTQHQLFWPKIYSKLLRHDASPTRGSVIDVFRM